MARQSGGQGWWVGDDDIAAAGDVLREQRYDVGPECWAALAGLRSAAAETGVSTACLLLTGLLCLVALFTVMLLGNSERRYNRTLSPA